MKVKTMFISLPFLDIKYQDTEKKNSLLLNECDGWMMFCEAWINIYISSVGASMDWQTNIDDTPEVQTHVHTLIHRLSSLTQDEDPS